MAINFKNSLPLASRFERVIRKITVVEDDSNMWEGGTLGLILAFRRLVKKFVLSNIYDNLMMLSVFINTIILAMDGLVDSSGEVILGQFNFIFTIVFTLDMGFKLIGINISEYLKDRMNIFDAIIVTLSLVELIFLGGGGSALSAFRVITYYIYILVC